MIRRVLSVLSAALLLGGCSGDRVLPLAPAVPALEVSSDIDLTGVLSFAELPDLSKARHAERYIRAAEGGVVELHGFRVEIPAGALPADTLVTIDLPTDQTLAKRVLAELGPHGIRFNTPVTISFPLEGVLLPGGAIEVRRWEKGGWTSLGGSTAAGGRSFFSTTPRFSTYVLASSD